MAQVNWQIKTVRYQPTTLNANVVDPIMNVSAGDLIGPIFARTIVAFDGSGTAAIIELGDDGDADRFLDGGEVDEETAGSFVRAIGASGGGYVLYRNHLYTAANTIDVNFTADTNADSTVGAMEFIIWWAKVRPF